VSQKNLRFILFIAILHFVVGSYSQSLHGQVIVRTVQEKTVNLIAGKDNSKASSVSPSPLVVIEGFSYKVLNLPLSLVIGGTEINGIDGFFYKFSLRLRVLNSLLAALIIFPLIHFFSRLMSLQEQSHPLSEVRDSTIPSERIAANLTDEKIWRIALLPILGPICLGGMKRSIRSDMIFVFCIHSVASLGINTVLRVGQEIMSVSQGVNEVSAKPGMLEFLRWILHVPLSPILGQKVLSQNPSLILLNSVICTFAVGVIRWWLTTKNESQR
jgi:hypothetical protein